MKKLLLFIAIIFAVNISAQTAGKLVSNGTVWTDSLGYGVVATSDSVWILDMNFTYESFRIFVEGNANSPVDSIALQAGTVRYNEARTAVDTVWGSYTGIKIAAGTYAVRMVNTATGADFILNDPPIQLLKFSLLNHRESLVTRNVIITVNGTRK